MTHDKVAGFHLDPEWLPLRANFHGFKAPGVEPTALGRVDGTGDIPLQHDPFLLLVGIQNRHGGKKGLRVRVERLRQESFVGGQLDHLSQVHDRDPVADMVDHGEVMGDQDVGKIEFRLQVS